MLRKLPLAMAVALAIAPFQSQALGLGKIQTSSVLNQPFDAEIQLLSVPQGELDGVKVNLASAEAFERAGIDRPFTLSALKFQTVRKPNGEAVIEVFSRKLIREPYLNFLVEVDWPKGRMVREFTVLLDPPLTTGRKQPSMSAPVASRPATQAVQTTGSLSGSGEYGPVQNNETLWKIANRFKPSGNSVNQMMLAILEDNPQAFSNNNINTLKAGSVLRMPSDAKVNALSKQQANEIANRQYQEWRDGNLTSVSAPKPVAKPVMDAADDKMPEPATVDQGDDSAMLRLSGSDVAGSEGAEDSEDVQQKLIAAEENLITSQSEADEMRSQLEIMEGQLADMKRLLELKDEQLAKLQAANDTDVSVDMETATEMAELEEGMAEESVSGDAMVDSGIAEEAMTEGMSEEAVDAEESMSEDMSEAKPDESEAVEETVSETEASQEAVEAVEAETAEVAETAVVEPEPVAKPEPAKEPSIVEMITGSATMMGVAVAVLVVLLALIWTAFSRSKKRGDEPLADKAAAAPVAKEQSDAPATAVTEEQAEDESSFLSEFTPADLEELDNQETGEVDPLSEADVYIAYGRFDQAEEMVLQALEAEPGKVSYQHKLLEIYYSNKDSEKFSELAADMHNAGAEEADMDAWNRAKLMGVELDPENPLFADASEMPSQDVTDDLDVALSELESQLNDDMDDSSADLNAISEDLEELNLQAESELKEQEENLKEFEIPEAPAEEEEVRLDLDDLNDTQDLSDDDSTIPLPEVDLDASTTTATDEEEAIEELAAELENFDIDDVDTSDVDMVDETSSASPTPDLGLPDDDDLLLDDDNLGDMVDDVSTKLDLARAYIEMGDKDGAKGILDEVMLEGSDAQKQEAETLMTEIS